MALASEEMRLRRATGGGQPRDQAMRHFGAPDLIRFPLRQEDRAGITLSRERQARLGAFMRALPGPGGARPIACPGFPGVKI